jgi:hypothetical protein
MSENGFPLEVLPRDLLLSGPPLPLERTYFPMGYPVRISTNSEAVIKASDEIWGRFTQRFSETPVEVQFVLSEGSSKGRPPAAQLRSRANLVSIVHSADNFAVCDLASGFGFGWLTRAVLSDHGYFRYHFLEPTVYVMLGSLYLAPIHAACVALDGSGVLLCGDSGAGKTSLAYACARRGWTYLTDDASHLVRKRGGRTIVGRPHHIRFRESAKELFPELTRQGAARRANGKMDIEVRTEDLNLSAIDCEVQADYLVFLSRCETSNAHFETYPPTDAAAWLEQVVCIGEEHTREVQRKSLRELLKVPLLKLCYRDFDSAERCLRSLVRPE